MALGAFLSWIRNKWDRVFFYGSLLCLIVLLRSFHNDIADFSHMVREDTQFLQRMGVTPLLINEAWVDTLSQRASDGAAFAAALTRDLFSVVKAPEVPKKKEEDRPALPSAVPGRFSLVKIFRQPVKLLFKGYLQLPDGKYSLQINWAGQTDFKQVGESIRGYEIERFEKIIESKEIAPGYAGDVDNSYVIIRKDPDPPVKLEKGKMISEKELFAKLFDTQTNGVVTVHVGFQIGPYKVLDITEDEVLLSDPTNQEIRLKRAK